MAAKSKQVENGVHAFEGFPKGFEDFFIGIRLNNYTSWFEEHRAQFESDIKRPMYALINALAPTMQSIDPQLDCRPARAMARLRRDTRFSNNKEPYRDLVWCSFRHSGETMSEGISYYFEISATTARWGCGFYFVERAVMDALRRFCLETPGRVLDAISSPEFTERFRIQGELYKRKPPPDSLPEPLQKLWQHKDLYTTHEIERFELVHESALADTLIRDFQTIAPFYNLLRDVWNAGRIVEAEKPARV
ncbi:MAG: DUF2461 domain-containing protein [Oscillospiraceae bacterium]|nr:DUF2461 domain-containing protein [Oscillospiraceae bacterium]